MNNKLLNYILILLILIIIVIFFCYIKNSKQISNEFFSEKLSYNDFLRKVTVMSSTGKSIIVIDKNIILDTDFDGINFLKVRQVNDQISVDQIIPLKTIQEDEILSTITFLNNIELNGIIIVCSSGRAFQNINPTNKMYYLFIKCLNSLGSQQKIFRNDDNYLLIITNGKKIFETTSSQPIYYPPINIKHKECRMNPENVNYPGKYVVFDIKSSDEDIVRKCATETNLRGFTKFGLTDNYCTPLSESDYNKFKFMGPSYDCSYGLGNGSSMMGYELDNTKPDQGVIFYEYSNMNGNSFILNEGTYLSGEFNGQTINSIYVPNNYFVFLIGYNFITPIYGPKSLNINNKEIKDINGIIIQRHFTGNVILCTLKDNKKICLTFGIGSHILFPTLYMTINFVKFTGDLYRNVSIYEYIDNKGLIQTVINPGNKKNIKIDFPRVVRSIKVE